MQYYWRRRALTVHFRVEMAWKPRSGEWGNTCVCHAHQRRRITGHIGLKKDRDNCRVGYETGGAASTKARNAKTPVRLRARRGFYIRKSAVTYASTQLPMQYYWRRRAFSAFFRGEMACESRRREGGNTCVCHPHKRRRVAGHIASPAGFKKEC